MVVKHAFSDSLCEQHIICEDAYSCMTVMINHNDKCLCVDQFMCFVLFAGLVGPSNCELFSLFNPYRSGRFCYSLC